MANTRASAGSIYAIGAVGTTLVKIGSTTTSVEQRLKSLQTGQPMALHIVARHAVESDLQRIERQIHAFLGSERQRGEWFALKLDADELAALIHRAVDYLADKDEQAQRAKAEPSARPVTSKGERPWANEMGQLIKARRQHAGMSQAELAKRADMTASKLSKIETGFLRLKVEDVLRFADALGCDPGELMPKRERTTATAP